MLRRNFIKNALCLGCLGITAAGCKNILIDKSILQGNLSSDKFIYTSKSLLPKMIRIEACSLCQLNCPECPARKYERTGAKNWAGYLKFNDFKMLVDDNDFEEIKLSNVGEIFLNPELDEIIKYAYKKRIRLTASVNLNSVSDATIENLVKYKFFCLTVSIDGATPETYKIYRRGGDFNKVVDNIKRINYFKEKYNSEFPKLIYQFIVFGHNEHEVGLAKKKAWELGMEIDYRRNWAREYSPLKDQKILKKLIKQKDEYLACKKLFTQPQINYNGDLLGCCSLWNESFGVNVFKEGLLNALNAKKFIQNKQMLADASYPLKKELPCSSCVTCIRLKKKKQAIVID